MLNREVEIIKGAMKIAIQEKNRYEQKRKEALHRGDYDLYHAYNSQYEYYAGRVGAYEMVLDLFNE